MTSASASETEKKPGSIVISIDFNKTEYALGEPVITTISVKNNGVLQKTADWISFNYSCLLHLEDMKGRNIMMSRVYGDIAIPIFIFNDTLKPGQAYSATFDLTRADVSSSSIQFPRLAKMPHFVNNRIDGYVVGPGTYRLIAEQLVDRPAKVTEPAYKVDGSGTFTIRESDEREKQALKLFETQPFFFIETETENEARKADAEQSQLDAMSAFDRVWNNYRDTVYAPYALYYAARVSQKMGDNSGAINRYTILERSCKDFPLMADLLYYKTIALKDSGKKDEAIVVGQQLKEKYWDHLVAPTVETKRKGSSLRNLVSDLGIK